MSDPNSPSGTGEIFNSYDGTSSNGATGEYSHAEGRSTKANGDYSHAEGSGATASGKVSHAEGFRTDARGDYSHAEGYYSEAFGAYSHAEGGSTNANGEYSHAEGYRPIANGDYSHAEGFSTRANGTASHAEGWGTSANGYHSHAEGDRTNAKGHVSHAEGSGTTASGQASHAEGWSTIANGKCSHAEGFSTNANGLYSHAEGYYTSANGGYSHAEGWRTTAKGGYSHAEGYRTIADGDYSHTQNYETTASADCETSMGRYNSTNSTSAYNITNIALSIGNGTSDTSRGNAFTVQFNGSVKGDMSYSTPAADYAEMFEWEDENPDNEDRVGYFVTVSGKKIRKALSNDKYILGIVSSAPGIIGDNPMRWNNKYLNDEWGRPIYEEVEVAYTEMIEQEDGAMKEETVYRTEVHRKLNPEWRGEEAYTDRTERKEWAAVGLLGKILVRQDGTLNVGDMCISNDDGIATYSNDVGYYVLDIINTSQALVMFK